MYGVVMVTLFRADQLWLAQACNQAMPPTGVHAVRWCLLQERMQSGDASYRSAWVPTTWYMTILNAIWTLCIVVCALTVHVLVQHAYVDIIANDVVEAHCYVVDIGRTDREQIRSRINNNWCRTFRRGQFCTQLTKAYVAETSHISCYWFCYVSAHDLFTQYR